MSLWHWNFGTSSSKTWLKVKEKHYRMVLFRLACPIGMMGLGEHCHLLYRGHHTMLARECEWHLPLNGSSMARAWPEYPTVCPGLLETSAHILIGGLNIGAWWMSMQMWTSMWVCEGNMRVWVNMQVWEPVSVSEHASVSELVDGWVCKCEEVCKCECEWVCKGMGLSVQVWLWA